ncbi:unnamed protein product [Acanthoscelides obtectus]|uniref:Uncharacterized protein n=1 Tax=Acanthoscelides obtectus TaxID=200917 RepID=A0A9P0PNV5_ACAOB|nr:unnamed protein product [Acanthoscelides obtectus]CAK1637957.1 hypothetical protein AOBTE_LOCUS10310 [Acanthoscelides obtectus]
MRLCLASPVFCSEIDLDKRQTTLGSNTLDRQERDGTQLRYAFGTSLWPV